jgi:hypothetical protein
MRNNLIPIKRGGQDELTSLYVHLLNAVRNEAASSATPLELVDRMPGSDQVLPFRRQRSELARTSTRCGSRRREAGSDDGSATDWHFTALLAGLRLIPNCLSGCC